MENGNTDTKHLYASVILPLKFGNGVTYIIPKIFEVKVGSRVKVNLAGKVYSGVVCNIHKEEDVQQGIEYKPILEVEQLPTIMQTEIEFWEKIASYYMCGIGEVFKAAYPSLTVKQEKVKHRKTAEEFFNSISQTKISNPIELSPAQQCAYNNIKEHFKRDNKPVLLKGVTGSGKTEIYINLALEQLNQGKNVLYLVPEIAISKQLQNRLKKVFGERVLSFHSKQTAAEKSRIHNILQQQSTNAATVILGTRSALFLPYNNLGLIVVDEEHDTSYKQTDPAPRYHGRDAAILLSTIHKCNILLGSATPSFESLYNHIAKKFNLVELNQKFYGGESPEVEIIDTLWARKSRQMRGEFSQKLLNEIKKTLDKGNQVLIFRNRRSYSPIVECVECGDIPKCPHCNVYLSYHKYNSTLRCHYCDYTTSFTGYCTSCNTSSLKYRGAGTEKLEEELSALLPDKIIARYDADITKSKKAEEQVIKDFSSGKIDILIGTQMISKGFDFEKLQLVAIINADTILGIQDFRGDEKALQIFNQLAGRTGRRGIKGKIIIQSNQKEHPVFTQLKKECDDILADKTNYTLLAERKQFLFAPYVRMIKLTIKHKELEKADSLCNEFKGAFENSNIKYKEITGPFSPIIDRIRGEWIKCFYIKLGRDNSLMSNKESIQKIIEGIKGGSRFITVDVDPL